MSVERAGVRAGDVLAGKYRVERVLGMGGMGVVVSAHHIQLDERVALKFLLPEAMESADAVARFLQEARAAVKIKNEHVVRVSDVGQLETGSPYIVMEYLQGEDLAGRLKRFGRMPIPQTVDFILQACEAIADAHALGIIHRDLKPANLFCTERSNGEPWIKVLDFGISKLISPGSGFDLTRTSTMMGSPLYMSPEQMTSSKTVDARADVWALAVIFFELVTGLTPFMGESLADLAIKIATHPTPLLTALRQDAPRELDGVMARALEKDRNRRFGSVGELAAALGPFGTRRAQESVDTVVGTLRRAGMMTALAPPTPAPVLAAPVTRSAPAATTPPIVPASAPLTNPSWGTTNPVAPSNRAPLVIAAIVGVVLLISGVVAAAVTLRHPRAVVAAAPSASASEAPAVVAATAPPSASASAVAVPDVDAAPPIVFTPPAVVAKPPVGKPHPVTAPVEPGAAPPPPVPSPRKPDCNPPYTIDAAGHREYKPQCL